MPKLSKVLFIPDTHIPYHDRKALELVFKVIKAWKPETLVVLGDWADMYSVSDHDKDPTREHRLEAELAEVRALTYQLARLPVRKKVFLAGNHEHRLARYIAKHAAALDGLVSLPQAVGLDASWEYVPYKSHYRLGKLYITHDADHAGKYALWQTQAVFQHSVAFGHTHGLGIIYTGDATGQPMVAANFGWLGDKKWIDYKKKVKAHRSYITGFGIGYKEPNGFLHLQAVPIVNNKCLIEGKLYK